MRDRSRDNTKGTVQYLVTYVYTNNNCLLCASNIIESVAIPTYFNQWSTCHFPIIELLFVSPSCFCVVDERLHSREMDDLFATTRHWEAKPRTSSVSFPGTASCEHSHPVEDMVVTLHLL